MFTLICNNCGETEQFGDGGKAFFELVKTINEQQAIQGVGVHVSCVNGEGIDVKCLKCKQELIEHE